MYNLPRKLEMQISDMSFTKTNPIYMAKHQPNQKNREMKQSIRQPSLPASDSLIQHNHPQLLHHGAEAPVPTLQGFPAAVGSSTDHPPGVHCWKDMPPLKQFQSPSVQGPVSALEEDGEEDGGEDGGFGDAGGGVDDGIDEGVEIGVVVAMTVAEVVEDGWVGG